MSETPEPGEFAFESYTSPPPAPEPGPPPGPDGPRADVPRADGLPAADQPTEAFFLPGGPADLSAVTGPAPVLVSFAGPAQQARLTVAFRAFLLIPHLIVLWVFGLVAAAVAFIGWWAALFTGQLPRWANGLLTGYLRWSTRVSAYAYFLTDEYPPFDSEDANYPVRLLTKPTRLNRAAVFFRLFLMLPAAVVAAGAGAGLAILSPIAWVITLVTGRMPTAWHQAFGVIIRFAARYSGYAYMVTPEYPRGLYGDKPDQAAQPFDPWRLVVSRGAKVIVTAALVLGLAGFAGYIGLFAYLAANAANSTQAQAQAYVALRGDYDTLNAVFENFQTQSQKCAGQISCITGQDEQVADALSGFRGAIQHAGAPSAYSAQVQTVSADAGSVAADFNQLATAQSSSQYQSIVSGLSVQADLNQFLTTFSALLNNLNYGSAAG
jgi:Domain of unknown function (DUF4389)